MTSLQTLLDEREIVRGLGRFARIADAKSFDEVTAFSPRISPSTMAPGRYRAASPRFVH